MRLVNYAVYIVGIVLIIASSSAPKNFAVTGGSRSDATLKLSYEYGLFETGVANEEQGRISAKKRCKSWGYDQAEPFDQGLRSCIGRGSSGCVRWRVEWEYQCVNIGSSTKNSEEKGKSCSTTQILTMSRAGLDDEQINEICK